MIDTMYTNLGIDCPACRRSIVAGDRIFSHEDGAGHPFHLKCIQQKIAEQIVFYPTCPHCNQDIDPASVLNWRERMVVLFQWAKQGARVGGALVLILVPLINPPSDFEEALRTGCNSWCNGAIYGAMLAGIAKTCHFAATSLAYKFSRTR